MASAPRSGSVDATPFLESSPSSGFPSRLFARRPYLRNAARFVLRVSGNSQPVREPSARVREAAADHLEGRRSSWSYSKPVVLMDLAWNLAFVIAAATVVLISLEESPSAPLRLWILGYGLQCVLHMLCVVVEYRRRSNSAVSDWGDEGSNSGSSSGSERGYYGLGQTQGDAETTSVSKHLESVNTMFCFIWWILGFYWVSAAGQSLKDNAPQLYWLCIAFMLFDVLFAAICVVVACLLGFAICCFLPCIIAILYAVADQDGATKEQIDGLPKYKYRRMGNLENLSDEIEECLGGMENALSLEDAECSICLSAYEEGVELRRLPCHHHFHSPCVDKWLCINATCPLCKFDIRMNGDLCCAGREA